MGTKRDAVKLDLSDLDADDSGEEDIKPYDVAAEPPPKLPTYHPSFAKAKSLAKTLVTDFVDVINKSRHQSDDTRILLERLKKLQNVTYPEAIKIGLIGDSGVGKSSLMNAILGHESLAPQGEDGASCTYVVQEFVQASPLQKSPFAAEVIFFSQLVWEENLATHLSNYYDYHGENSEGVDMESRDQAELEARTALEVFRSLFADCDQFKDDDAGKDFLSQATSHRYSSILALMTAWTLQLLAEVAPEDGVARFQAPTLPELRDKLKPYLGWGGQEGECSPWPLVKMVKVGLYSPLLKEGIIIADLPGISDTNRCRVNATASYLRECDYSVVVAPIKRVETDLAVHCNLMDAYRRRRSGSVLMVCTCIDDTGSRRKGMTVEVNETEQADLDEIEAKKTKVEALIDEVKCQLRATRRQWALVHELNLKKQRLELRKKQLSNQAQECRIQFRNAKVAKALKQNTTFLEHMLGEYSPYEAPTLSVECTGIPALRSHLYRLPAKRMFRALEHHCRVVLETLLNTIAMSCSATKLKRRDQLMKLINASETTAMEQIALLFQNSASSKFEGTVSTIMGFQSDWMRKAATQCQAWGKYHHSTHKAFCRRNGSWQGGKKGKQNWNQQVMEIFAADVERPFANLDWACVNFTTDLNEALSGVIDGMRTSLTNDIATGLLIARQFFDSLVARKEEIREAHEELGAKLRKRIGTVKIDIIMDSKDTYLCKAMNSVYKAAFEAKADGRETQYNIRRKIILAGLTGRDGAVVQVHEAVDAALKAVLQQHRTRLTKDSGRIFEAIRRDFAAICSTEDETPAAVALRDRLGALVPTARAMLRERICVL